MKLTDDWARRGTDLEELKGVLTELAQATGVAPIALSRISLLSVLPKDNTPDIYFMRNFAGVTPGSPAPQTFMRVDDLTKKGYDPDLFTETKYSSKLMISAGPGDNYFTSARLSRDLADQAGIQGEALYKPDPYRDAYLMHRYVLDNKDPCTAIIRTDGKAKKLFALGSPNYALVPQTFILDLVNTFNAELSPVKCREWAVTHFFTSVLVEFPDVADDISATYKFKDKMIPGLLLETSDTRDCSVICTGVWRREKSSTYVRGESYSRKHIGSLNIADIISNVRDKVYSQYTKLPERLAELAALDLTPAQIQTLIRSTLLKAKITGPTVLGKQKGNTLIEVLCSSISPDEKYTGYNFAMMLMDIPEMVKFKDSQRMRRVALEEIALNIIFDKFEKNIIAADDENDGIVISPIV